MPPRPARFALQLLAALSLAKPAAAQDPLMRGFDLEQQGRLAEAAAAYRGVLAAQPAALGALLGAERVYAELGRRDSTVALVRRALAVDSTNHTFHTVLLRTLQALRDDSGVTAAFDRWTALAPRDPAPYEELARLLIAGGREAQARALVQQGRQRLGDPHAAAAQMGELEMREGAYGAAAEEWRAAVARTPPLLDAAVYSLRAILPMDREATLRTLTASGADQAAGRAIAVDLLLAWEEPRRALGMLRAGLPSSGAARSGQLRHFADAATRAGGVEAQRTAGEALELLAQGQPGTEAAATLIEGARAFAGAGDAGEAQRMLRALADRPGAPAEVAAAARATLVELAAEQGSAEEAARLLDQERGTLPAGEYQRLAREVGFAWLRSADPDRAAAAVEGDSSLAGEEVRGWVALYRGDLKSGAATLRSVGADAGDPDRAPERAAAVALVAAVGRDSLPALGAALLRAAAGDSGGASRALAAVAGELDGEGQAEVRLLAARFAVAAHDTAAAAAAWTEIAARSEVSPAGAAALLALARVAIARGRFAEATERLEALILRNPSSALVPEARRELDRVRGLVPHS
jgi:hypothetical protein